MFVCIWPLHVYKLCAFVSMYVGVLYMYVYIYVYIYLFIICFGCTCMCVPIHAGTPITTSY